MLTQIYENLGQAAKCAMPLMLLTMCLSINRADMVSHWEKHDIAVQEVYSNVRHSHASSSHACHLTISPEYALMYMHSSGYLLIASML